MLIRLLPPIAGFMFFIVPLFPPFITLTTVSVPGVSLVPAPVAIALLLLMALIAVYGVILNASVPGDEVPTLRPLLIWLGAAVLSAALGFDPLAGAVFLAIFGFGIVWHVSVLRYYAIRGFAAAIYYGFLISGILASLAALLMVITRMPASQYAIGHGRAIGTFILPGELAGYLIIYLLLAFALARTTRSAALRTIAIAGLVCGTPAFVLTFSRAGEVGLAAAIAGFVFAQLQRFRLRTAAAIVVVAVIAIGIVFNSHHNPSENYTRLSIWQAGLGMVQRFPFSGVGPFVFAKIYPLVRLPDGEPTAFHAHSFLLTTAAETGIIGVAAALFAWWRFVVVLRARLRTANASNALLASAVAAGLFGTWVQGLIDTVSVVIFGLWLPFMAVALSCAKYGLAEA
ncbi:MAG: O-antigen ligase family protein [Candidatus Eremiobacteraeota bacterium]|nr:O-antigen ligase family protein [Candidatus Eremiobacteraeota bacterium]